MSDRQIANGWTAAEAAAVEQRISARVGAEYVRSEPSNAEYRRAEAKSDATHPMHDAARERQADAHKPVPVSQEQRDASRSRASAPAAQATDPGRQQAQQSRSQGIVR